MKRVAVYGLLLGLVWLRYSSADTVYLNLDMEDGTVGTNASAPPWWNCTDSVSNVTTQAHGGSRSLRMPDSAPTRPAGGEGKCFAFIQGPNYTQGGGAYYYSAWYYLETGFDDNLWKNQMQWKGSNATNTVSNCDGKVKAIIGFVNVGGVRNIKMTLRHWVVPGTTKPTFGAAYIDASAAAPNDYNLSLATPPVIPKQEWIHLETYIKATPTNGALKVWYTRAGVRTLVYDLAHENLDAVTVWCNEPTNTIRSTHKQNYFLWNSYNSIQTGADPQTILYSDDVRIADFPLAPAGELAPEPPTDLTIDAATETTQDLSVTRPTQLTDDTTTLTDFAGYRIERCSTISGGTCTPGNPQDILLADLTVGAKDSWTEVGLSSETQYRYRVAALRAGGPVSAFTAITSGDTSAGPPPTLVAHWTMDAASISGMTLNEESDTHDGTLVGSPTTQTGALNEELVCDGSDDRVQVADHAALDLTGDMSLAFWLTLLSNTNLSNGPVVLSKDNPTTFETPWLLRFASSATPQLRWYHHPGVTGLGNSAITFSAYTVPLTTPATRIHVAVTRLVSTRTLKLFVNGTLVDTKTYGSDNPAVNAQPVQMCVPNDLAATRYAHIALDDVRIYSGILNDGEIATLAQGAPVGSGSFAKGDHLWRYVDEPENGRRMGAINGTGRIVKGASARVRFEITRATDTSAPTEMALYCETSTDPGVPWALNDDCATKDFCYGTDLRLAHGVSTSAQLAAAGDFVGGELWEVGGSRLNQFTLASGKALELEAVIRAAPDTPLGTTVSCKPGTVAAGVALSGTPAVAAVVGPSLVGR